MRSTLRAIRCAFAAAFVFASLAHAAGDAPAAAPAATAAAPTPPNVTPQFGPKTISLGEQGSLNLPEGYVYLDPKDAAAMMTFWGNPGDHRLLGLVLGRSDKDDWAITLRFRNEGYVKDEDAKTWDADELFKSVKEGTEESNAERKKLGGGEMHILDWVQKPTYDATKHRLVWGMRAESIQDGQRSENVNYRTYVLGREGYIEMNLMTEPQALGATKSHALQLLDVTRFNDGKRYEDFTPGTDRVAEYGLAALVAGGVAKKLGFFAVIGVALVKFWKLILIGFVFFGGAIAKLFKRKAA